MAKAKLYTINGEILSEINLPSEFDSKINPNLIAQVVHVFEAKSHTGFSKVKTRAEVNRTKRKLYKQKGTGGARHGSRRAPIFVGGGIAHGPKLEERVLSLPKKIKIAGRNSVLSLKFNLGEVVAVSGIEKIVKTKEILPLLRSLNGKRYTFLLSEKSSNAKKALANLENVKSLFYKDVNAFDLLKGGILILDNNLFDLKKTEDKAKKEIEKTRKVAKK